MGAGRVGGDVEEERQVELAMFTAARTADDKWCGTVPSQNTVA